MKHGEQFVRVWPVGRSQDHAWLKWSTGRIWPCRCSGRVLRGPRRKRGLGTLPKLVNWRCYSSAESTSSKAFRGNVGANPYRPSAQSGRRSKEYAFRGTRRAGSRTIAERVSRFGACSRRPGSGCRGWCRRPRACPWSRASPPKQACTGSVRRSGFVPVCHQLEERPSDSTPQTALRKPMGFTPPSLVQGRTDCSVGLACPPCRPVGRWKGGN